MRHQLDFEKPIAELQSKLEELKKNAGTAADAADKAKGGSKAATPVAVRPKPPKIRRMEKVAPAEPIRGDR